MPHIDISTWRRLISARARRALLVVRQVATSGWARRPFHVVGCVAFLTAIAITYVTVVPVELSRSCKGVLYLLSSCVVVFFSILLERGVEDHGPAIIKEPRYLLVFVVLFAAVATGSLATLARSRIEAETVVAQDSLLLAYGDGGQIDWARPLPSNIIEHSPLNDLDGDGVKETVVVTEPYDGRGSRLVIIKDDQPDVVNSEVSRYGGLPSIAPGYLDEKDIPLVYPYPSRTFEVVDLLVQDLDGLDGQEILLLANDTAQRYAPSLILGLKGNGELAAYYWHFGRLQTARVLQTSRPEKGPLIVVLAENPLVEDDVYASAVFALSGTEFFSGGGPMCWNLTTTMASNYVFEMEELRTIYDDDLAVDLGCLGLDARALAWYEWIEPGVTVEEMSIGWVEHCEGWWMCWHLPVVSLSLSNGCPVGINEWGKTEFIESIRACPSVLRPVLIRPWRH